LPRSSDRSCPRHERREWMWCRRCGRN